MQFHLKITFLDKFFQENLSVFVLEFYNPSVKWLFLNASPLQLVLISYSKAWFHFGDTFQPPQKHATSVCAAAGVLVVSNFRQAQQLSPGRTGDFSTLMQIKQFYNSKETNSTQFF